MTRRQEGWPSRVLPRCDPLRNPSVAAYLATLPSAVTRQQHAYYIAYFLGHLREVHAMEPEDLQLGKYAEVVVHGRIVGYADIPYEWISGYARYLEERVLEHRGRLLSPLRAYLRHIALDGETHKDLSLLLGRSRSYADPQRPRYTPKQEGTLLLTARAIGGDVFLIVLLLILGFRPQEVGRLEWQDFDLDEHRVWVSGKRRDQPFPLPVAACRLLAEYRTQAGSQGPLFPRHLLPGRILRGQAWGTYLRRTLRRLQHAAGVTGGSPYWFRRTAAQTLHDRGQHPIEIQRYLRHRWFRTASNYVLWRSPRAEEQLRQTLSSLPGHMSLQRALHSEFGDLF